MGSILDQLRDYQPDQSLTNQGPTTGRFQTALRSMSDGQYDPSKGWLGPQAVDVVAMVGDMALAEYEKQMEKDTFLKRALGVASIPAEAAMAMGRGVRDSIAGGTKSLLDIDSRHMNNPEIMRYATEKSFDTAANAPVLGGAASFVLNSAIPPKGALGMNVWQGGPHKYGPKGASESLQHMGTGEGAQAYGWGRYDAGAEAVGREYADAVGEYSLRGRNGDTLRPSELRAAGNESLADAVRAVASMPPEQGVKWLNDVGLKDEAIMAQKLIDDGYNTEFLPGHVYKHDLPDEDIARYLDWDKKIKDQPQSVKDGLAYMFGEGKYLKYGKERVEKIGELEGRQLMEGMFDESGLSMSLPDPVTPGKKGASEALGRAGIPGLKYYDGMSRKRPIDDLNKTREGLVDLRKQFEQMPDGPNKDMQLAAQDAQIAQVDADIKIALSDKPQTRNYVTWDQDVLDRMKLLERNGETFSANPRNASLVGSLTALDRQRNLPSNSANPLPIDEASRMARADDMFPFKGYHGSTVFEGDDAITSLKSGKELGENTQDYISITGNPGYANKYSHSTESAGGVVYPVRYSAKMTFDYKNSGHMRYMEDNLPDKKSFNGVSRKELIDRIGRGDWTAFRYNQEVIDVLKKAGFDSLREISDGVPAIGIFDGKNIRSKHAKFDPARRDSADLLAANPATASVLGILDEIERAQEMKDFIARGGA